MNETAHADDDALRWCSIMINDWEPFRGVLIISRNDLHYLSGLATIEVSLYSLCSFCGGSQQHFPAIATMRGTGNIKNISGTLLSCVLAKKGSKSKALIDINCSLYQLPGVINCNFILHIAPRKERAREKRHQHFSSTREKREENCITEQQTLTEKINWSNDVAPVHLEQFQPAHKWKLVGGQSGRRKMRGQWPGDVLCGVEAALTTQPLAADDMKITSSLYVFSHEVYVSTTSSFQCMCQIETIERETTEQDFSMWRFPNVVLKRNFVSAAAQSIHYHHHHRFM